MVNRLRSIAGLLGLATMVVFSALIVTAPAASAQPLETAHRATSSARPEAASIVHPDIFIGDFILKNTATKRCVDDSARFGLRMFTCNNESFQEWRIDSFNSSNTIIRFQNLNTHACIQKFPQRLGTNACSTTVTAQRFFDSTFERNGHLEAWFQLTVSDFGCLSDSTSLGLHSGNCTNDPSDTPSLVWQLD